LNHSNHQSAQIFEAGWFRAPDRAQQALDRLRPNVPNELLEAALALLAESPDPDQSLNLFERLVTSSGEQITRLLNKNRVLLHYTLLIFGHSYWLGETIIQHPDILRALERDKQLDRSLGQEDYLENLARFRSRSIEIDAAILLARFKKREYVRILLRDVLGIATLAETTAELSALADVILKEALQEVSAEMRRRFGAPEYSDARGRLIEAPFAVVSLGKLGGNEINYSSDVDLLFLYDGEESGAAASLREYFSRQAQLLTELLSRPTPEGSVFRIDLRLRPQGNEGPPAVSLLAALEYYANVAHDWELQALIKTRCSAGDTALAREFIRQTQSRVYTKDLNFAAIETGLLSREKIQTRVSARRSARMAKTIDVKLDRGGIRDIEFLVQCLQRVYGGEERWLRSGGTLFSLQKLHDKGHISGKDFHELTLAYEFFRRIEHRLQVQRGRQLHRLPAEPDHLKSLQRALGPGSAQPAGDLLADVQQQMARVAEIYDRIIHSHRRRERKLSAGERAAPSANSAREMSFAQILERLAEDCPELHAIAAGGGLSLHLRRGLHRFLSSALTSRDRYAPLLEKPDRLRRALSILETSDHLTEVLVRYPDAIKVLDQFPPGAKSSEHAQLRLAPPSAGSGMDGLSQLRTAFRKYSFAIGAQDVLAPRPAFAAMRQSSLLADEAIRLALELVHGRDTLAVFALGRLGTSEFDIASDADLLFVRPERSDEDDARSAAEKLVQALSAYTREGSIFAVDTRLRPHGGEGELVITPAQFERYLTTEAQPWEALSYTKLRFVAGREELAPLTVEPAWRRIIEIAAQPGFAQAVLDMRSRIENSNRYPHSFKQARGGFYDIDFIASYLMLRRSSISGGNTLERLEHLRAAGVLDESAFTQLRDAAMLYRTTDHVIRLVTGRARPELPEAEHARDAVEKLVNLTLTSTTRSSLQQELDMRATTVRSLFEAILFSSLSSRWP
jgi:glutamate-ammonia-ligase adenylyltransferase